jgi:DnaK suppressor protein
MNTEDRQTFRKKLEETITQTEGQIAQLEEDTRPISPENSLGRITRMDAINNKSVAEAALRTARRKLAKLKLSLSKLEEPDFGQCSACKANIPVQRLMFMPESTHCVRCASRR